MTVKIKCVSGQKLLYTLKVTKIEEVIIKISWSINDKGSTFLPVCRTFLTKSGKENTFFIILKVHEFSFHTHPDRPWGPPSLLYNGYRVFPGGKAAGAWH